MIKIDPIKNKTIMGIDPSLNGSGVCILRNERVLFAGQLKYKSNSVKKVKHHSIQIISDDGVELDIYPIEGSGKVNKTSRAKVICDILLNLSIRFNVDMVVIEGYAFASVGMLLDLAELGGMIKMTFFNLQVYIIPPSSMKMYITGKGNCDKEDIQLEIKTLGYNFRIPDISDAFSLAFMLTRIGCGINDILLSGKLKKALKVS